MIARLEHDECILDVDMMTAPCATCAERIMRADPTTPRCTFHKDGIPAGITRGERACPHRSTQTTFAATDARRAAVDL